MWCLDRLGKQIEAVRDNLLLELGNAETQSEVLRERELKRKERKKEARQSVLDVLAGGQLSWNHLVFRQPSLK
jgi:hypothetical protein